MGEKERVLIERLDADYQRYGDECEELESDNYNWYSWDKEDVQEIMQAFRKRLKSYKELILWSQEKEL